MAQKIYYDMADFYQIDKIDAHVHMNQNSSVFIDEARHARFKLLTINVDYPDFPPLEIQQDIALSALGFHPGVIAFAATFDLDGWDDRQWQNDVINHLDSMINAGAVAVKVWKNIGMDFRDADGNLIMIDDAKFDTIFTHLQKKSVTLIGHMGEPKSCWLPADEIPIKYVREYFINHPNYHMYLHPEMPSYEDQLHARDNMLEKNRNIEFVGAHFASLEWSVDELARFLNRFPAADVDMAARMGNIQYQSSQDREKVQQFFIDYQDRILYGTDLVHSPDIAPADFKSEMKNIWLGDWKYLATDLLMNSVDFEGKFQGLQLPAAVLDKIYRINAKTKFSGAWERKKSDAEIMK